MSGADFFYGTTYQAFAGSWSGEPSVGRVAETGQERCGLPRAHDEDRGGEEVEPESADPLRRPEQQPRQGDRQQPGGDEPADEGVHARGGRMSPKRRSRAAKARNASNRCCRRNSGQKSGVT